MWRSGNDRERKSVVCIACGTSVLRAEAREYDKEGDRWERQGKQFEHLCKECYTDLSHQPRHDLEALLVEVEREGTEDREAFLKRYLAAVEERHGSAEGPES